MNSLLVLMVASGGNLWEKMLVWYDRSLIKALIDFLYSVIFSAEIGTYENFSFEGAQTVRLLIWGMVLGMIIATGMMTYTRNVHGRFVRTLLKRECYSADKALTLRETGMFRNASIRSDLAKGGALSKIVRCAEEEKADGSRKGKKNTPDFLTARYYIPEDLKYRAEIRYDRTGSGWPQFVLSAILFLVAAVVLSRYLPSLIGAADWLISAFS